MLFRYYPLNVAALVLAVWNPNKMELYYYYIFIYIYFGVSTPPKVWSAVQKQVPMTVLKKKELYNAKSGILLCIERVYACCSQCSLESLISSLLSVFCLCEQELPHEPLSFSPLYLAFFPTLYLSLSFQLFFVSPCPHSPNVLAKHLCSSIMHFYSFNTIILWRI